MNRSRFTKSILSITVLLLICIFSACNKSKMQLYTVELNPGPGLIKMEFEGQSIYANKYPIIFEKEDFTSITVENNNDESSVLLSLSREGLKKMQSVPISGSRTLIAIVVNKKVLYVAGILEPFHSYEVLITGFNDKQSAIDVEQEIRKVTGLTTDGRREISNEVYIGTESYNNKNSIENPKFIVAADQSSINDITNDVIILISELMKEMKYKIIEKEELINRSYENTVFLAITVRDFETNRMTIEINGGMLFIDNEIGGKINVLHIWRGVFGIDPLFFNDNKIKCIQKIIEHYQLSDMRTSEFW